MTSCPHCGRAINDDRSLCPHCGARRLNPEAWPPPPVRPGSYPVRSVRLLTGKRWGDILMGIVSSLGGMIVFPVFGNSLSRLIPQAGILIAVGLATPLLLAIGLRAQLPVVALGARCLLWTIAALILGAFALYLMPFGRGG